MRQYLGWLNSGVLNVVFGLLVVVGILLSFSINFDSGSKEQVIVKVAKVEEYTKRMNEESQVAWENNKLVLQSVSSLKWEGTLKQGRLNLTGHFRNNLKENLDAFEATITVRDKLADVLGSAELKFQDGILSNQIKKGTIVFTNPKLVGLKMSHLRFTLSVSRLMLASGKKVEVTMPELEN